MYARTMGSVKGHTKQRMGAYVTVFALLAAGACTTALSQRASDHTTTTDSRRIVMLTPLVLLGADTVSPKLKVDTASVRTKAVGECGVARLCVAGSNLRLLSVTAPQGDLPVGQQVPIAVTIENHGRVASHLAELKLCTDYLGSAFSCREGVSDITVPSIASGERIRILSYATLPHGDIVVSASLDPARTALNRDPVKDKAMVSATLHGVYPALEFLLFDVDQQAAPNMTVRVHIQIHNVSVGAASGATELLFSDPTVAGNDGSYWGGTPEWRLTIPPIGPEQTLDFNAQIDVSYVVRDTRYLRKDASIGVWVDMDRKAKWEWDGRDTRSPTRSFVYKY